MTVKKRLVTALVALTIPAAMVNPIAAADQNVAKAQKEVTEEANTKNLDPALKSDAEDMEQALEVIESIPDDVLLKGDAATKEWLESNQKVNELNQEASVWGCAAAIAGLIGGNLIAAGKLLKIKRLIKSLGGAYEAARIMWGASFKYEKMIAAGGALGALASEFFGITQVRQQCFE
mgnify:FL=1